MSITASMVKDLREKTGAGMMDCKAALQENNGDFEASVDWLRKKGIAKAEKKAGRTAAEGMVFAWAEGTKGGMVEVNSETDFVAKNENFQDFVKELGKLIAESGETDVEKLKAMPWKGGNNGSATVGDKLTELVGSIGENMQIRRATYAEVSSGVVKSYLHMGGKIGVLLAVEASTTSEKLDETAKNIAMHVAASAPQALNRESIDPAIMEREKAIFEEQARAGGKPENIVEKIVDGRINKFFEESCLVEQPFVMDTDRKVNEVLKDAEASAEVKGFWRFALGEGIEKKEEDFAAEVAAAVNG